jgi:V8-like Glu-specific endopeptidase
MIRQTIARMLLSAMTSVALTGPVPHMYAADPPSFVQDETNLTPAEIKAAANRSSPLDSSLAILGSPAKATPVAGLSAHPGFSLGDRLGQAAHQLTIDAGHAGQQALRGPAETGDAANKSGGDERIINGESRTQVTNTQTTPFKAICYLYVSWPNGTYSSGSAEFVGKRVVLSAGHMVYDYSKRGSGTSGWAKSVRVVPGKNGSSEPYGSQYASTAYVPNGWITVSQQGQTGYESSCDYDMSWIIMPDQTLFNRTGYAFGYQVASDSSLKSTKLNIAGYPGDKPAGTMWTEFGGGNQVVYPSRFRHYLDTYGGSSGAPMWYYNGTSRYVWGVNVWEVYGNPAYNVACRMNQSYFNTTQQMKSQFP